MENGKWKVENGKWKVESGKWKMESGKGKEGMYKKERLGGVALFVVEG